MKENIYSVEYILENNIDKDSYGFIYITTNMINGKKYIGQKIFRYNWQSYLGSGQYLKRAVKKYGRENFRREIIAIAYSKEELNNLEIEFINIFNAVNSDDYYNIADGGDSGNKFAGKTEEEMNEIKQRMSESRKGKHHSEESKQKMSKPKTEETKKYMSENHADYSGSNHPKSKKVICITTGEIFDYIRQIEKLYSIPHTNISDCCKGKQKSAGKLDDGRPLQWQYYDNYLQGIKISEYKDSKCKKIVCTTTKEVFKRMKQAEELYGISHSHISKCCQDKQKSCGKHPITGEKLGWMYYDDYILKYKDENLHKIS